MATKLLAPMLALSLVISGMFRWDAPATVDSSNKSAVTAAKHGCPWSCSSVPVARGRDLARRTCAATEGLFLVGCTVLFNRVPSGAAVSSLTSMRASAPLRTLHHLQVKLQV